MLGTIRATVMVETLLAAVNMEEMLYEIKDHCCGMNAGRWDYIFSAIKRLSRRPDCVLPDRKMVRKTGLVLYHDYNKNLSPDWLSAALMSVAICHLHVSHDAPYFPHPLPPQKKKLHNHCLQVLLGRL